MIQLMQVTLGKQRTKVELATKPQVRTMKLFPWHQPLGQPMHSRPHSPGACVPAKEQRPALKDPTAIFTVRAAKAFWILEMEVDQCNNSTTDRKKGSKGFPTVRWPSAAQTCSATALPWSATPSVLAKVGHQIRASQ